jgi:DNA-binding transcriptional regulator YiaG
MEQRKDRLGESGAAQVRALLAQGLSQAAVATTMGVTVETVRAIATNRSYPVSQTWRSMVDTLLAFPETTR